MFHLMGIVFYLEKVTRLPDAGNTFLLSPEKSSVTRWVVYYMLFCKLVIFSLSGVPVKDTIQRTNRKAAVGSLVDFNFGLW